MSNTTIFPSYTFDMFDFITWSMTKSCMLNGVWAMNHTNMWKWLRDFEPLASNGFMFSSDKELNIIGKIMESSEAPEQVSHSEASFCLTMRNLKYIANNGLDAYRELYLKNKQNQLKENQLKENQLKENQLKENQLKDNQLKENQLKENQLGENQE
jgi:hypothetical protein